MKCITSCEHATPDTGGQTRCTCPSVPFETLLNSGHAVGFPFSPPDHLRKCIWRNHGDECLGDYKPHQEVLPL